MTDDSTRTVRARSTWVELDETEQDHLTYYSVGGVEHECIDGVYVPKKDKK